MLKMLVFLSITFFFFKKIQCDTLNKTLPTENNTKIDPREHLKMKHIRELCEKRHTFCKTDNIRLCAIRRVGKKLNYKDFDNSCHLFMSNMCEHPGDEYYIVDSDTCENYLKARRTNDNDTAAEFDNGGNETFTSHSEEEINRDDNITTPEYLEHSTPLKLKSPIETKLRFNEPKYSVDYSFDGHLCPLNCPNIYRPVCVNTNIPSGIHTKFFQFLNHCQADVYYCKHPEEFAGPPSYPEDEQIQMSELGWSKCGSIQYVKFAQFATHMASLAHYGWLGGGKQRYSRIIPKNERKPGFGKR